MSALERAIDDMEIFMERVSPIQPKPVSKTNSVAADVADLVFKAFIFISRTFCSLGQL